MAWTTPKTYADGVALTAAELNTYLRDNLNETMVAHATRDGSMFFGTDLNELAERYAATDRVDAFESTTSSSYADLATVGPSVTLETGSTALVMIASQMGCESANSQLIFTYKVTGASSIAANSGNGIVLDGIAASTSGNFMIYSMYNLHTDLAPGENTFTCQYRTSAATTSWFGFRFIAVWPM